MNSDNTSPRLAIPIVEAGERLSVGRSTAFELVRSGQLPTIVVGKRRRVPVAAIERMLETAGTNR